MAAALAAGTAHAMRNELVEELIGEGEEQIVQTRTGPSKGTVMQVPLDHIAGGESSLRQVGEEEFIDAARPRDPDGTLLVAGGMSRHHHAAEHARRSHRHLRTIVKAAHHLAFRTLLELIGRQVQACLDEGMVEHAVLFASGHESKTCEIAEHRSRAILAVKPNQGARGIELIRFEIATNGSEPLAQFLPIAPVPTIAETADWRHQDYEMEGCPWRASPCSTPSGMARTLQPGRRNSPALCYTRRNWPFINT